MEQRKAVSLNFGTSVGLSHFSVGEISRAVSCSRPVPAALRRVNYHEKSSIRMRVSRNRAICSLLTWLWLVILVQSLTTDFRYSEEAFEDAEPVEDCLSMMLRVEAHRDSFPSQGEHLSDEEIEERLREFWNATGGPNWFPLTWDFEGPWYCWPGIEHEPGSDQYTSLSLPLNNLNGYLPDGLFTVPFDYIRLSDNKITGTLPDTLCQAHRLSTMIIVNSLLEGSLPSCLCEKNIQWTSISLPSNHLSGSLPDGLYRCSNLELFSVFGNRFSGTLSEKIVGLERIHTMDISDNKFTGALPVSLGQLRNLRHLYISKNHFNGTIPIELARGLNLLSKLIAFDNELEGPLSRLTYLANASVIHVARNRFTRPFIGLQFLSVLTYLDFSYNNVTDALDDQGLLQFTLGDLSYFNGEGNDLRMKEGKVISDYQITFAGTTRLKTSTENWSCKSASIRDTGLPFIVSPSVFNYTHCACIRGYYGLPPNDCYPCPIDPSACSTGEVISIPSGQYPYPVSLLALASTAPPDPTINLTPLMRLWQALKQGIPPEDLELSEVERLSGSDPHSAIPPPAPTNESSKPVRFEKCEFPDGCSSLCSVGLWRNPNDSSIHPTMIPPEGVPLDQCKCKKGYEGRKCARCICRMDPKENFCFYRGAQSCKRCDVVWSATQGITLLLGVTTALFIAFCIIHTLMLRSKRQLKKPMKKDKDSLLRRAFYRILHVRTIGYFKSFLIWAQTLTAIIRWPSATLQRVWAIIEVINGSTSGIGAVCLWPLLSSPVVNFLFSATISFFLIILLSISVWVGHFLWVLIFRPRGLEPTLISSTTIENDETVFPEYLDTGATAEYENQTGYQAISDLPLNDTSMDYPSLKKTVLESPVNAETDATDDNDSLFPKRSSSSDSLASLDDWTAMNDDNAPTLPLGKQEITRYFSARSLVVSEILAVSYFFYFGITLDALSFFDCQRHTGTDQFYFTKFTWMDCHTPTAKAARLYTIPFLTVVTAGVPILFASLLFWYRKRIHLRTVNDIIGGLYRCYRKGTFWWELVILARRLMLALVLKVNSSSAFHPWGVVLVLVVSVALQFFFQPFNQRGENRAEEISLLLLLLTYAAQEFIASSKSDIKLLFWIVAAMNLLFTTGIVVLLFRSWCTGSVPTDDD